MLTVENPEANAQLFTVAPAEGQRPLDIIITNANFEAMCNPDKLCFGTGTFNAERPKKERTGNTLISVCLMIIEL